MIKLFIYSIVLFLSFSGKTQNVGIGTNTPQDRLDINGNVRSTGVRIVGQNILELGFGLTKQADNGKIGLNVFGEANTLSIVGGGTAGNGSDRRIKMWADGGTVFTGGGQFSANVGIGAAPGNVRLVLQNSNSGLLSLQNSNALNTGVSAAITFGGSNYTTGIIQTIGTSSNQARMGFFTGYSFANGINVLGERISITNEGRIGINRTNPSAQFEIGSGNSSDWIRIVSDNEEVFRLNTNGIKFDRTKSSYRGAALINSDFDGLGKWGFAIQGAEVTKNSEQPVAHGVSTRINFDFRVFDHNNTISFDDPSMEIANITTDQFRVFHQGIALIEFEVNWAGSPGGLGGGGLRNGAIQILRNGTVVRTIPNTTNNHRDRCYIQVGESDVISINAYHEHCVDPPPICLTGIARTITTARVTVIIL
jgi:hypothetical protein